MVWILTSVLWSRCLCTHRLSCWILRLGRELRVLPRPAIVPGSDSSRPGLRPLLRPRWHPIGSHRPPTPTPTPTPPPPGAPLSRGDAVFLRHGVPPPGGLTQSGAPHTGLDAQWDVWARHALHHRVPQWQRIHQPTVTTLLRNERRHCLVIQLTPNDKAHLDFEGKSMLFFCCPLFIDLFIHSFIYLFIYLFICLHSCYASI